MKKILGLDLGTNSIGWAVVNADEVTREDGSTYLKPNGISAAGSRIIPMSADILGDFEKGNTVSQTAERKITNGSSIARKSPFKAGASSPCFEPHGLSAEAFCQQD